MNTLKRTTAFICAAILMVSVMSGCDMNQDNVKDNAQNGTESGFGSLRETVKDESDDVNEQFMDVGEGPYFVPAKMSENGVELYSYEWQENLIIEHQGLGDKMINNFCIFEKNGFILPVMRGEEFGCTNSVIRYDDKGKVVQINYYTGDYTSDNKMTYDLKYDENEHLSLIKVKLDISGFDDEEDNMHKTFEVDISKSEKPEFQYNRDGILTRYYHEFFYSGDPILEHEYAVAKEYDDRGNFIRDLAMSDLDLFKYEYSENGIKKIYCDFNNLKCIDKILEYDNSGKIVKRYDYNGSMEPYNKLYRADTYEYDENDRLIKKQSTYVDGKQKNCSFNYEYNFDGRLSEVKIDGRSIREYEYDENGMLVKAKYDSDEYRFEWSEASAEQYRFYLRIINDEEFSNMSDGFKAFIPELDD